MAKKKKRKARTTKKKKSIELFSSFKRMLIWACVLLICLFALLYLFQYLSPIHATDKSERILQKEQISINSEIPISKTDNKEQIVAHSGYTVSYNPKHKIANWVAYELTRKEIQEKRAKRSDKFRSDPEIKGGTPPTAAYARSGYDRGHLAPAADMKWSEQAMRESFYTSNICPQRPSFNRGIWKQLEELIREWALADSALLIAAGPVLRDNLKLMGGSNIAVPDSFYKVIVSPYGKNQKGIGFLFANKDYKKMSVNTAAVSIDRVEEVTGIDFFAALPDELEQEVESAFHLEEWQFN